MNPVLQFFLFFFPPALWLGGLLGLLMPRRLARWAMIQFSPTIGRATGIGTIVIIWLLAAIWMLSPAFISGEFTFFYLMFGGGLAVAQFFIWSVLHADDRRKYGPAETAASDKENG